MKKLLLLIVILFASCNSEKKENLKRSTTNLDDIENLKDGDTLAVQVFTFEDIVKRRDTIQFPDLTDENMNIWEKIYMIKTLKCDEKTPADKYPCGEWDYCSYTIVYKNDKDTVEEFELENYVTPYGLGLDLGEDGFTYVYDMTDYIPLLRGSVDISSGSGSELQDVKFLFIKGTPPKNVLSVKNIYPRGNYNYGLLSDNKELKPVEIILDKNASSYMLRARISGHGHFGPRNCCEWDRKSHSYLLGSYRLFKWEVWKNCGDNAIYPQGGTWQFDRAGWCPGTPVDTYDFDLTSKVGIGDTIMLDYAIEPYIDNEEKGGSFRQSHQIFSYGEPNFKIDASVENIIAPNNIDAYSRVNPICKDPKIIIQNRGSQILKSVKIKYGILGGIEEEYLWTGNLIFLEKETVKLSGIPIEKSFKNQKFFVELSNPNDSKDENINNNIKTSDIIIPKILPSNFTLFIKSNGNGRAKETSWVITNSLGKVLYENTELEDNKEYKVKIENLPSGCYELRILDSKEDGMIRHWWNRNSNRPIGINGKIEIHSTKKRILKQLKFDFAESEIFKFIVE